MIAEAFETADAILWGAVATAGIATAGLSLLAAAILHSLYRLAAWTWHRLLLALLQQPDVAAEWDDEWNRDLEAALDQYVLEADTRPGCDHAALRWLEATYQAPAADTRTEETP